MTSLKTDSALNEPIASSSLPIKDIANHCKTYQGADETRSIMQLVTTFSLFAGLCVLMFYSLEISYFLTLALAIPAGGLLTRIFIFQHDCGHGSFFKSKKVNDWVGRCLSMLTITPYDFWRRAHNMHHATSGDLDRRSIGGIDTITVREFMALPDWKKVYYRLYRNPFLLLILGTPFYVIIAQRLPFNQSMHFYEGYKSLPMSSIWKSILLTNIGLVVFYGTLSYFFGFMTVIAIALPILVVTSWVGGWLFYIQHQFEDTYWEDSENWNLQEAALTGSSYYELPVILQWFTGNIGLHHIHHLCSKIPNYKLQECMDARPELRDVNRMTLRQSLDCLNLKFWDEETKQLVGLDHLKTIKV